LEVLQLAVIDKDKRIKKEIVKLRKLSKDLDEDKKKAVEKLIENIAFMSVTLEDLQVEINKNGVVESYQNGENQSGKKQSSALQSYNALIKNYTSCLTQLLNQLPDDAQFQDDGFDAFLKMNK